MLINLRNALMAGKRLPYDARVAWLEGTGTQYISTGIHLARNMLVLGSYQYADTYSHFGGLPFWIQRARAAAYGTYQRRPTTITYIYVSAQNTTTQTPHDTDWHTLELDTSNYPTAKVDGVTVSTGTTTFGGVATLHDIVLFARRSTDGSLSLCSGKVASFSVRDLTTNNLLIDLIPVRQNGVGYMYDSMTGNFLGNAGTGDFVLGPDTSAPTT